MSNAENPTSTPLANPGPYWEEASEWVTLAILKRPQGRKGELLAELLTDFPDRFLERPDVLLAPIGYAGPTSGARAAKVSSCWLPVGRNQGRVVLGFDGIDSITAAEALCGLEVIVPADERVELPEEETYISDLAGCMVFASEAGETDREPRLIGTVEDVAFPTTADGQRRLEDAAPLLIVRAEAGHEHLIPYVKEFIVRLSLDERRLEMTLPPGLLDLNQPNLES